MLNIKICKLKNDIRKYKKIVMYGAGDLSQKLYSELKEKGITIEYFVVTKRTEKICENIPIYEFEEKKDELNGADVTTIISVTEKYEDEIECILVRAGCLNYLKATDYLRDRNIYERYRDKNKDQYLWEIAEWLIDKNHGNYNQIETLKRELEFKSKKKERNCNSVIFLVVFPSVRVKKMAQLLYTHGYSVYVLDLSIVVDNNDIKIMEGIKPLCTGYRKCECIEDIMNSLIDSDAFVCHIFNAGDSSIAYTLIKMKLLFPPFIYEQYDVYNGMYNKPYPKECMLEKLCLESADGVCNRGYELEYVKNKLHFEIQGKIIHFLDYCQVYLAQQSIEEKELSLCYVGGVISVDGSSGNRRYCFEELSELCRKNHCHLHMYPIIHSEELRIQYAEIEKTNEYFHVHKLVNYDSLINEISQYDYGILPAKGNIIGTDDEFCTSNKYVYATNNKYFSYIEAGLPIIAVEPQLLLQKFIEQNMVFQWTIDEYDFDVLRRCKKEMKENVIKNRQCFDINHHFERLIDFYKSL